MSVHRIMQCKRIISCIPGTVKAKAMVDTLTHELTNLIPATMLKQHSDIVVYLDCDSAALLDKDTLHCFAG